MSLDPLKGFDKDLCLQNPAYTARKLRFLF